MNNAIILAAGFGKRMEQKSPKQFIKIKNKMVLDFSVDIFEKNKNINEIIIVCNSEWMDDIKKRFHNHVVVKGGINRSKSSYIGLKSCNENTTNVLIHDAARPFVNHNIINSCIDYLEDYDAVIPVLDCKDSLINENTMEYLDRDSSKIIQTPQAFNYNEILSAYKNIDKYYNDDFSVYLHSKKSNYLLFKGDFKNIKLTTKEDLKIARYYLDER